VKKAKSLAARAAKAIQKLGNQSNRSSKGGELKARGKKKELWDSTRSKSRESKVASALQTEDPPQMIDVLRKKALEQRRSQAELIKSQVDEFIKRLKTSKQQETEEVVGQAEQLQVILNTQRDDSFCRSLGLQLTTQLSKLLKQPESALACEVKERLGGVVNSITATLGLSFTKAEIRAETAERELRETVSKLTIKQVTVSSTQDLRGVSLPSHELKSYVQATLMLFAEVDGSTDATTGFKATWKAVNKWLSQPGQVVQTARKLVDHIKREGVSKPLSKTSTSNTLRGAKSSPRAEEAISLLYKSSLSSRKIHSDTVHQLREVVERPPSEKDNAFCMLLQSLLTKTLQLHDSLKAKASLLQAVQSRQIKLESSPSKSLSTSPQRNSLSQVVSLSPVKRSMLLFSPTKLTKGDQADKMVANAASCKGRGGKGADKAEMKDAKPTPSRCTTQLSRGDRVKTPVSRHDGTASSSRSNSREPKATPRRSVTPQLEMLRTLMSPQPEVKTPRKSAIEVVSVASSQPSVRSVGSSGRRPVEAPEEQLSRAEVKRTFGESSHNLPPHEARVLPEGRSQANIIRSTAEEVFVIKPQATSQTDRGVPLADSRRSSVEKNVLPRRQSEMRQVKPPVPVQGRRMTVDPLLSSFQQVDTSDASRALRLTTAKSDFSRAKGDLLRLGKDRSTTPRTKPRITTPEPAEPPRYAETAPSGRSVTTLVSSIAAEEVSQLEGMVEDEERSLRHLNSHFKQVEWEDVRRLRQEAQVEARLNMKAEFEFQKKQDEEFRIAQVEAESDRRFLAKLSRNEEVEDMRFVKAEKNKEIRLRQMDDLRRARMKSAMLRSTSDREGLRLQPTEEDIEALYGRSAADHEELLDQTQLQARAGELRRKYSDIVSEKQRLLALLTRFRDSS
jgi:hypothetical protein